MGSWAHIIRSCASMLLISLALVVAFVAVRCFIAGWWFPGLGAVVLATALAVWFWQIGQRALADEALRASEQCDDTCSAHQVPREHSRASCRNLASLSQSDCETVLSARNVPPPITMAVVALILAALIWVGGVSVIVFAESEWRLIGVVCLTLAIPIAIWSSRALRRSERSEPSR